MSCRLVEGWKTSRGSTNPTCPRACAASPAPPRCGWWQPGLGPSRSRWRSPRAQAEDGSGSPQAPAGFAFSARLQPQTTFSEPHWSPPSNTWDLSQFSPCFPSVMQMAQTCVLFVLSQAAAVLWQSDLWNYWPALLKAELCLLLGTSAGKRDCLWMAGQ